MDQFPEFHPDTSSPDIRPPEPNRAEIIARTKSTLDLAIDENPHLASLVFFRFDPTKQNEIANNLWHSYHQQIGEIFAATNFAGAADIAATCAVEAQIAMHEPKLNTFLTLITAHELEQDIEKATHRKKQFMASLSELEKCEPDNPWMALADHMLPGESLDFTSSDDSQYQLWAMTVTTDTLDNGITLILGEEASGNDRSVYTLAASQVRRAIHTQNLAERTTQMQQIAAECNIPPDHLYTLSRFL